MAITHAFVSGKSDGVASLTGSSTQTTTSNTYVTKTQNLTQNCMPGDTIELWAMCDSTLTTAYVQNFRLAYDDAPTVAVASWNI